MSKELIIVDIQNDYFENGTIELVCSLQASENAKQFLSKFRSKKLPIVHIQHLSVAQGSSFFLPDTKGQEIHENVKPLDGEKVIEKYYPNSFRDTGRLEYLKSQNVTELVFVGMMTQTCIDATVRAAIDLDFQCTVIGDACVTLDLELNGKQVKATDVQTAFLAGLSFFYADIKNAADYLS